MASANKTVVTSVVRLVIYKKVRNCTYLLTSYCALNCVLKLDITATGSRVDIAIEEGLA